MFNFIVIDKKIGILSSFGNEIRFAISV